VKDSTDMETTAITSATCDQQPSRLEVRVTGPDSEPLSDAELRRLFPGSALTQSRLERLRDWPRVSVHCGERLAAVATCHKTDAELRVPDIGLDRQCACSLQGVVHALLDALELAGLAGGCRRLVLMPPREFPAGLDRRGYVTIAERCAGGWLEKTLV
jgi:hypothetical protein